MTDVFLFNGPITRSSDIMFIDLVFKEKRSDECLLILVTPGGSPDAAFKIARYLQSKYEKFSVLVSGLCKSAGTLLSVGAYELIFMPYGELGPLDVQMVKTDNLAGMESGLNIGEAFMALELRTRETYSKIIAEIIQSSGGVVSFQTAAHAASEVVSAMYGPIFSRIDPEEVGSRSRAMRIGEDYCKRLNAKWSNLKPDKLSTLSQTYSSHGFVIDRHEAAELFQRVRDANDCERAIVSDLGNVARHPSSSKLTIKKIPIVVSSTEEKADDVHPVSGTEKGTRNLKPKRAYAGGNSKKPSKLERIEAKSSAE